MCGPLVAGPPPEVSQRIVPHAEPIAVWPISVNKSHSFRLCLSRGTLSGTPGVLCVWTIAFRANLWLWRPKREIYCRPSRWSIRLEHAADFWNSSQRTNEWNEFENFSNLTIFVCENPVIRVTVSPHRWHLLSAGCDDGQLNEWRCKETKKFHLAALNWFGVLTCLTLTSAFYTAKIFCCRPPKHKISLKRVPLSSQMSDLKTRLLFIKKIINLPQKIETS